MRANPPSETVDGAAVTLEQTITDTVTLEPVGPAYIATFAFASADRQRSAQVRLLDRAEVDAVVTALQDLPAARRTQVVDAVAALATHHFISTDPTDLLTMRRWSERAALPDPVELIRADPTLAAHLVSLDGYNGNHWRIGERQRPLNTPFHVNDMVLSDHCVYVDALVADEGIRSHPWVLGLERDPGRPGSYDHVAASAVLRVQVPDEVHDAVYDHVVASVPGGTDAFARASQVLLPGQVERHGPSVADILTVHLTAHPYAARRGAINLGVETLDLSGLDLPEDPLGIAAHIRPADDPYVEPHDGY